MTLHFHLYGGPCDGLVLTTTTEQYPTVPPSLRQEYGLPHERRSTLYHLTGQVVAVDHLSFVWEGMRSS